MALYAGSVQTIQASNGLAIPMADLKASAVSATALVECCIFAPVNTVNQTVIFGIGRSTAELLQLSPTLLQPADPADKPTTTALGLAWSSVPVVPTQFFRRMSAPIAASGSGVIWTFPRGLKLAASQSLVFWQFIPASVSAPNFLIAAEVEE